MRSILSWSAAPIALFVLAAAAAVTASGSRETLVVTAGWLAAHLKDPDLVLLHVGEKPDYDLRHIPGARFLSLKDVSRESAEGDLMLEMLPADTLRDRLQALGISDNSNVIVYYGKDWITPATRAIFTLEYAGVERVSLLDGGMDAWVRDGQPVTDQAPSARSGSLAPLTVKPLIVDAEFVRSHANAPGFALVDARDPAFFDGTKTGGRPERPHKTGHIPGARSIPFSSIANGDLTMKSAAELAAAFERAGVRPGDTVITYCHIGQQATATLFAARTLGYKVLLYDGSFEDWSKRGYEVVK